VLEANDEYIELLVLSTVNGSKERAMKTKSELSLPGISWFVSQQKSAVNVYFVAGAKTKTNSFKPSNFKYHRDQSGAAFQATFPVRSL
jgi:hypothetical protein